MTISSYCKFWHLPPPVLSGVSVIKNQKNKACIIFLVMHIDQRIPLINTKSMYGVHVHFIYIWSLSQRRFGPIYLFPLRDYVLCYLSLVTRFILQKKKKGLCWKTLQDEPLIIIRIMMITRCYNHLPSCLTACYHPAVYPKGSFI